MKSLTTLFKLAVFGIFSLGVIHTTLADGPSENSTCEEAQSAIERLEGEINRLANLARRLCSGPTRTENACSTTRGELLDARREQVAWEKWSDDNCPG